MFDEDACLGTNREGLSQLDTREKPQEIRNGEDGKAKVVLKGPNVLLELSNIQGVQRQQNTHALGKGKADMQDSSSFLSSLSSDLHFLFCEANCTGLPVN